MKRLLILLSILILAICTFPTAQANAELAYLKVEKDGVMFYENTAVQDVMFILPKTFYVKIISLNYTSTYHLVEYNGVRGLVKISDLPVEPTTDVQNPYYTDTLITAHINAYLYSTPSFSAATQMQASGLQLTYLGKVNGDKGSYDTSVWFAVLYANDVYYLHCSLTNNLGLLEATFAPVHSNSAEPVISQKDDLNTQTTTKKKDSTNVMRLVLILGVLIPFIIIVILLFKPTPKKHTPKRRHVPRSYDDYYDEDYYEE